MKEEETKGADLTPYIDAILCRFRPAQSATEATHQLSTGEIKDAIKDINPSANVTNEQVFDAMIEAGFRFEALRGTQSLIFKWLLVDK